VVTGGELYIDWISLSIMTDSENTSWGAIKNMFKGR